MVGTRPTKFMNFDFSCDIGHIKLDLPHQMWEAISADGNANTLVTRFLHNTPSFYANNLLRCYLSYFSLEFINQAFSFVGLILFLNGLWQLVINKRWKFLLLVLVAPLFPTFDLLENSYLHGFIIYGAISIVMVFGIKRILILVGKLLVGKKVFNFSSKFN